jgi:hypothetical protein
MLLLGLSCLSCVVPPPANPLFIRRRSQEQDTSIYATVNVFGYEEQQQQHCRVRQERVDAHTCQLEKDDLDTNPYNSGQEFISVRMEFGENETKTVKEITHQDGSKTVTTIIEPKDEENAEEDEFTVDSREDPSSRNSS